MNHSQALRLALDALGKFSIGYHVDAVELNDLIATLESALEQPEQPEQEPVAWRTFDGEGGYDYRDYDDNENYRNEWDKRNPNHKGWVEPLYASPPGREWQSLTEEDERAFLDGVIGSLPVAKNLIRAIEAALKEKNHD